MSMINANVQQPMSAQEAEAKKQESLKEFERNRKRIETEPNEFPGLISTMHTTTIELAQAINELMSQIFSDYYGAKIQTGINMQTACILYFSEENLGTDGVRAIEPVINKNDMSTSIGKINALNYTSTGAGRRKYQFTKDANEMFRDVINRQNINRNGKVDWNKISTETSYKTDTFFSGYNDNFTVRVGLLVDLERILQIIFGGKTEENVYQYKIAPFRPLGQSTDKFGRPIQDVPWEMFVMRCGMNEVRDLAKSMGYVFGDNSGIVRAR